MCVSVYLCFLCFSLALFLLFFFSIVPFLFYAIMSYQSKEEKVKIRIRVGRELGKVWVELGDRNL